MASLREVYEKITILSPPRPWPATPAATMAGAAALLRNKQEVQDERDRIETTETALVVNDVVVQQPAKEKRLARATANMMSIAASPAQRAAANQLLGPTGLTPIGVHAPRPSRPSGDDWRKLLKINRQSSEEDAWNPALGPASGVHRLAGTKRPLPLEQEEEEKKTESLFPPSVDPILASTAVNLDTCLDAHDVARAVKEVLDMEMPLDAVATRLEEGNSVADAMAVELSHVPPRIACGVPPHLGTPMYRAPGRLLPASLEQ